MLKMIAFAVFIVCKNRIIFIMTNWIIRERYGLGSLLRITFMVSSYAQMINTDLSR